MSLNVDDIPQVLRLSLCARLFHVLAALVAMVEVSSKLLCPRTPLPTEKALCGSLWICAELAAMIEATSKLLQQVVAQQAAADHLSELSVQCGGTPLILEELEQLAEETGLKAMLWSMQQEMRDCAGAWMQGPLFESDVRDMQAKVCMWAWVVGWVDGAEGACCCSVGRGGEKEGWLSYSKCQKRPG